jgi:hypothetical protein
MVHAMTVEAFSACAACAMRDGLPMRADAFWLLGLRAHHTRHCVFQHDDPARIAADTPRLIFGVHPADRDWVLPALGSIVSDVREAGPAFRFLVQYKPPPEVEARCDDDVRSYALTPGLMSAVKASPPEEAEPFRCYFVARRLLDAPPRDLRLDAIQLPRPAVPAASWSPVRTSCIVPHRGFLTQLDACLCQLQALDGIGSSVDVQVCFDEALEAEHAALVARHPEVTFSRVEPPGTGPYVPRHVLGMESPNELILWQDSDDVPCSDRWTGLLQGLYAHDADLVGSHELEIDEMQQVVRARRAPLDVNAAFEQGPRWMLLFPNLLMRTEVLRRLGGFTTTLRFGADVQFVLRAALSSRIRNVDAFLYVRRRRSGSLTTAMDTGHQSSVRIRRNEMWKGEARRVQRGGAPARRSSLDPYHGSELHERRVLFLDAGTLRAARERRTLAAVAACPACFAAAIAAAPHARRLMVGITAHGAETCAGQPIPLQALEALRPRGVVVLHADDRAAFTPELAALAAEHLDAPRALRLLVPRRSPPESWMRVDEEVGSYAFSGDLLALLLGLCPHPLEDPFDTYVVFAGLLHDEPRAIDLRVIQLPIEAQRPVEPELPSSEWIVPHAGPLAFLERCLSQLAPIAESAGSMCTTVCFDEPITPDHEDLMRRHAGVHYHQITPPGAGPFVPSHVLGLRSKSDVVVWQDSDDVSCRDRLRVLARCRAEHGSDFVGSHELRVDDLERRVLAVRFPLDVNQALREFPRHALLHPTSMITPEALRRIGGFTTRLRFASDTQLLWRAAFTLRIRNADEFLYVRRRRAGSLTSAEAGGVGAPTWLRLRDAWTRAYARVREGSRRLEESDLRPMHGKALSEHTIVPLNA